MGWCVHKKDVFPVNASWCLFGAGRARKNEFEGGRRTRVSSAASPSRWPLGYLGTDCVGWVGSGDQMGERAACWAARRCRIKASRAGSCRIASGVLRRFECCVGGRRRAKTRRAGASGASKSVASVTMAMSVGRGRRRSSDRLATRAMRFRQGR